MMMKVVIRPQANHDLVEIALHIGADSRATGERFLDAFEYTSNLLVELPTIGSLCRVTNPKVAGLRAVAIRGFRNHLLLYKRHDEQIEVVRVIHGARDLQRVVDGIECVLRKMQRAIAPCRAV